MAILKYMERNNLLPREQHDLEKNPPCLTNLLIGRENRTSENSSNIPADEVYKDLNKGLYLSLESIAR